MEDIERQYEEYYTNYNTQWEKEIIEYTQKDLKDKKYVKIMGEYYTVIFNKVKDKWVITHELYYGEDDNICLM